jgi:hypothetical protein
VGRFQSESRREKKEMRHGQGHGHGHGGVFALILLGGWLRESGRSEIWKIMG